MGSIAYAGQRLDLEDRLLAHLQIVIVKKLRRGDGFLMSWVNSVMVGSGRSSIWLDRSIPLRFAFLGSRPPTINRDWLQALATSADTTTGLIVYAEDGRLARCGAPD
jgi:hypothetical protein